MADGEIPPERGLIAVAAGAHHVVVLHSGGEVICVGRHDHGQDTPPEDLTDVTAVAAGSTHSMALVAGGTVVCWGDDRKGQCSPPEGLEGVVAIAGGGSHSLALRADGTVVAWGDDRKGQCSPPEGLEGVVGIAAGDMHSMALCADGTVVEWPEVPDWDGQGPEGLKASVIAAGMQYGMALGTDGELHCWGDGGWGFDNDLGEWFEFLRNNTDSDEGVGDDDSGEEENQDDELGGGRTDPPSYMGDAIAKLGGLVKLAAGGNHSVALMGDGSIIYWGWPDYYDDDWQFCTYTDQLLNAPDARIIDIASCGDFYVLLTDAEQVITINFSPIETDLLIALDTGFDPNAS